jgi:hypothetical protein
MSAIAAIVISDGQATPVAHTFNPVASAPNAFYRESQSGLALIGQGRISTPVKFSQSGDGVNRVTVKLELPALETITAQNAQGYTAAPKVAYTNTAFVTFLLPGRGTAAQRKDLRVLLTNLLANAQVVDLIENLNVQY